MQAILPETYMLSGCGIITQQVFSRNREAKTAGGKIALIRWTKNKTVMQTVEEHILKTAKQTMPTEYCHLWS